MSSYVSMLLLLGSIIIISCFAAKVGTDDNGNRIINYNEYVVWIIIIILSFYSGLRTAYNDTLTYLSAFQSETRTVQEFFQEFEFSFKRSSLFELIQVIIKNYTNNQNLFLIFWAFLTNALTVKFIQKYSTHFVFSMFLFITLGMFPFSMAGIRQAAAMAIGIWAIPLVVDKKWVKYIIIVILAMLIQTYALIFFIIPFMFKKPYNKATNLLLLCTVLISLSFSNFIGFIESGTELLGYSYGQGMFLGQTINPFRVLTYAIVPVLALLYKNKIRNIPNEYNAFINLSIISFAIMFLGLFGTANSFARLGGFFNHTQIIAIPLLIDISFENKNENTIVNFSAVTAFLIFMLYGFYVMERGIWYDYFRHISISQFVSSLF